ncbi:MAG TPA: chorismate mutase, partial [Bacillota bacterium]|nr:chorismate mutase [Bacillota bacterium]
MKVRGIRGATTARRNEAAEILDASRELLQRIVEENRLVPEEIAAVHFSVTPDLDQAFPARAAR